MAERLAGQETGGTGAGAPDRVYAALRARILNFDLPPGAVLSRNEIAEAYGVSQTPVRDALQRLGSDGLVRIYPQSRTVVAPIDARQLSETHFLRVAVETEVVRRLARTGAPETIKRARGLVQMQRALVGSLDQMDLFWELDRDFHRSLFDAAGVGALDTMVTDRMGHLIRCQRLELPRAGKTEAIVAAHAAILDGIASGDPERAAQAMRDHLSGTIGRVESIRAEHPGYFTEGALG
ncbi:GntR family transcriptional regulator [Mesobacterium pallidum]|uniref:GntR family transcriptional regulator n=1 Tax=Mesobacterium pallidum TaxID=2872037 RepID=UPI001EE29DCE|nr:GntR family transcriptional regulator [Mesobacterium pallidum]